MAKSYTPEDVDRIIKKLVGEKCQDLRKSNCVDLFRGMLTTLVKKMGGNSVDFDDHISHKRTDGYGNTKNDPRVVLGHINVSFNIGNYSYSMVFDAHTFVSKGYRTEYSLVKGLPREVNFDEYYYSIKLRGNIKSEEVQRNSKGKTSISVKFLKERGITDEEVEQVKDTFDDDPVKQWDDFVEVCKDSNYYPAVKKFIELVKADKTFVKKLMDIASVKGYGFKTLFNKFDAVVDKKDAENYAKNHHSPETFIECMKKDEKRVYCDKEIVELFIKDSSSHYTDKYLMGLIEKYGISGKEKKEFSGVGDVKKVYSSILYDWRIPRERLVKSWAGYNGTGDSDKYVVSLLYKDMHGNLVLHNFWGGLGNGYNHGHFSKAEKKQEVKSENEFIRYVNSKISKGYETAVKEY